MIKGLILAISMVSSLLFGMVAYVPSTVHAVAPACDNSILGLPTWYKYLESEPYPDCSIIMPADPNGQNDWAKVAGLVAVAIIEVMLRIASMIAVGFVIYGGFRFIASQGEPDNAKAARETVINAIVGLVITIVAASIISFITSRLTS